MPDEGYYSNIRDFLGGFVGARLVDITQHDREEWEEEGACYVMLHFDNGQSLKFHVGDQGFDTEESGG